MIFIQRNPIPAFLTVPGNPWDIETQDAILYYANPINNNEFEFKQYRNPQMKNALMDNFPKCVYCESSYAGVSDGDIEHFRPKGRVLGKTPPIPGYYWLANSWDNLFMSCMHCNQIRKHRLLSDDEARSRGKLDQFPLRGGNLNRIVSHNGNISAEEPYRLLLNPCIDKPENHLKYDQNALIESNTPMGQNSIEVYVLQRPFLVRERQLRLALLFTTIQLTKEILDLYNLSKNNKLRKLLNKQLDALAVFTDGKQPYAGMCRFFVKQFLKENNL